MNRSYLLRIFGGFKENKLSNSLSALTNAKMFSDRDCLGSLGKWSYPELEQKLHGLKISIQVLCDQKKDRNKKDALKSLWLEFNADIFLPKIQS